jgi:exodeoxyribonuclease VII small subunit
VVSKLEGVVSRLERGELSLEDSLKEFEEGIRLVRLGERALGAAERRVEELLQDGAGERTEPLAVTGPGPKP